MRVTPGLLEDAVLPRVEKPNRYLGNILHLDPVPAAGRLRVLLLFPDLLENSPLAPAARLRARLNARGDAAAELGFAAAPDLAAELRARALPLFSLESHTPVPEFDLLVVHLAREGLALGLLECLELAGLPLLAADRTDAHPLVAAGGPAAFNPEPLSDFVDVFALGDLEAGLDALAETALERRAGGDRAAVLRAAAGRPGLYVPALYEVRPGPRGRLLPVPRAGSGAPAAVVPRWSGDAAAPAEAAPLLPLTELSEDRLEVELARGCSEGCHACRHGSPHRAWAPRDADAVAAEVLRGLDATGWEEACLVLPAGAPGAQLVPILEQLDRALLGRQVVVSVSGAWGGELAGPAPERLSRVRRGPLHLAPLAGSARLRAAVGLPADEAGLLAAVRGAQRQGWHSVRLEFAVGLPEETEADLDAAGTLARRAQAAAREAPADAAHPGGVAVSAALEVFVPRPHTRFERAALPDLEDLRARLARVRRQLPRGRPQPRRGDPERAYVEGLLARGDRRMGRALRRAHELGCRVNSLGEPAWIERWRRALAEAGVDEPAARAAFAPDEPLPWDMFRDPRAWDAASPGPAAALAAGAGTPAAAAAGPANGSPAAAARWFGRKPRRAPARSAWQRGLRFRLEYAKGEPVRFTAHLELVRALERAVRRAGLPLAYSQGHTPHARLSSGPPLPLGFTSRAEYLDLEFTRSVDEGFTEELNAALGPGLAVQAAAVLAGRPAALSAVIDVLSWRAWLPGFLLQEAGLDAGAAAARWSRALEGLRASAVPVLWPCRPAPDARTADARVPARGAVVECRAEIPEIRFDTPVTGGIRPEWFAARLTGLDELDPRLVRVERTGQWVTSGTRRLTPLMAIPSHPGVLAAATDWS